jgi:hypothetical protein
MKNKPKRSPLRHTLNRAVFRSSQPPIPQLPPSVAARAAGRDHFPTADFAALMGITPQTARKNFCVDGACYGIKPIKMPNRRLLWPVSETAALLQSSAAPCGTQNQHGELMRLPTP